jgi:hypothetical protein
MRKFSMFLLFIFGCSRSTTGDVKCTDVNCTASAAMTISNVVGTVSGGSNGFVRSQLKVEGKGFAGDLTAKLVAASGDVFDLVIGTAEASTVTVTLPETLRNAVTSSTTPTAFSLVMTSSINGTATRDVSILQGEPGAPGAPGTYTVAAGSGLTLTGAALSLDATNCGDGQVLVRQAGAWVCKNIVPQIRFSVFRQGFSGSNVASFETSCNADEVLVGGNCTCDLHGTVSYSGGTGVGGTELRFGPLTSANASLCTTGAGITGTCDVNLTGTTPVTGAKWRCNAISNDTLGTSCYAQAFCMKI